MHVDAVGAFLIVVANATFWSLIFLGKSFTSLARSYFGWALFITLWSLGYGITLSGLFSYEPTLIWNKYCQAMATMIGPFFFKFSCDVAGTFPEQKKIFKFYLCFGIINAVLLFFTPYYVKGLWSFGTYPYQPLGGPLYIMFVLFFMWCTLHSYLVVALQYKKSKGLRKTHMKLFLIATGVAYFGGVTLFFQGFKLPVPTTGVYLILSYVLIIGYSIHKYKFLDIESIVKKTVAFAGVFGMAMVVVSIVSTITQGLIGQYIKIETNIATLLTVLIAIALYNPTDKFLIFATDKFLFQKKEDALIILKRLSGEIVTILDLKELGQKTLFAIDSTLRPQSSILIVQDETGSGHYSVIGHSGSPLPFSVIHSEMPFLQYFKKNQATLNMESVDTGQPIPEPVLDILQKFKAALAVPLVLRTELLGILILGKKKSDQQYDARELDVLPPLAGQLAIAISNAKLLHDIVIERQSKIEAESRAELVNYSRTISHELGNTLVGVMSAAENVATHTTNYLKRLEALIPKESVTAQGLLRRVLKDLPAQMQTIIQSGKKAVVIARTASGALKNDQKSMEIIYFNILWNQSKLDSKAKDGVIIQSQKPDNYQVYGNLVLLSRVFINLMNNSMDAMQGRTDKQIQLKACYRLLDKGLVSWMEYSDNGPGIPRELHQKIFEQGFSTKPKPNDVSSLESGHGQGMYVVKHTIETIHGGKIWIDENFTSGAKFILWLPAGKITIPENMIEKG